MSDTKYADVSEFQVNAADTYPYQFIAIRSNDGTYLDKHFAANLAWCKKAVAAGHMKGFITYFVWEQNWQQTLDTFKTAVGAPHARMAVMVDVEGWGGKITGDHSAGINAACKAVEEWLVSHGADATSAHKRVIGYANAGDFAAIWPNRGDRSVVLANYASNPDFPHKIAHQYANNEPTPPFGPCDINSADGLSPQQFAQALGLVDAAPATPDDKPRKPKPKVKAAAYWRARSHRFWLRIKFMHGRIGRLLARLKGKKK